ncbi:ECF RNA polymerase sigma factor SigK [Nocardiopsis deserti]|uniref:ECF RNA polymerase sigma factor SigK n=1 Tax=Nocardiopsis deserti TaxID=2605988 RepID=UPI00123AE8B0|nr:ECF RNA polymerase sigma factor SigK [Nocardiopsis deserti]
MERTAEWGRGESDLPDGSEGDPLARLLQQTATGDLAAFEGVYRELSGRVFGIARRVVLDEAQAEEICQEVFLEVWRTCSRYDRSRGSVAAWVLTIAHRRAVDRVRSEQAASSRLAAAGRLESGATSPDAVPEQVEHRLERERVRRCLRGLTEAQREAVRLTYYTGYTQRQAADLLEVPLTTVKGRLRDGLIRLRDCLGVGV